MKPLASAVSDAGGTFELQIDADQKTYTVVYCANGYTTYVARDLPNLSDGEPTIPIPVFLRIKESQQTGAADFQGDVIRQPWAPSTNLPTFAALVQSATIRQLAIMPA
ncbi:hypothetical protein [Mesorhizobium sp. B2-7-1]|uniref:hypothetical protein n=1 Tax=Mesorhizobium sp. B2-7-1 TaxID=2589909 RepID=UPI0011275D17|nr:hypothetical protein [Mesorhizobium sp. B2-7-1]TPJ42887.1 hypothetical protein FJ471_33330 [Mesorhizobium sp. B2-7-1]